MATLATQPLIVAKVGLQSRPPPARNGKPFSSFVEVMRFIIEHEGVLGLFKGIAPQLFKGLMVQGILMMAKERSAHPTTVGYKRFANTAVCLVQGGTVLHTLAALYENCSPCPTAQSRAVSRGRGNSQPCCKTSYDLRSIRAETLTGRRPERLDGVFPRRRIPHLESTQGL